MITALFSAKIAYTILAIVLVAVIVWLIFRYPQSRVYVWSIFVIAISATAVYCGIKLNLYYNSQGGVYGYITSLFNKNNSVEVDSTTFTFENIVLTQEDDAEVYSASMFTNDVIKLDDNEEYAVLINNTPCTYVSAAPDFLKAEYTYNFYGREEQLLHSDTLELYFGLNDSGIRIEVLTRGGTTSVKYWSQYFANNNFVVKLEKAEKISDDLVVEGEVNYNFTPEQMEEIIPAVKGKNIGTIQELQTFSARANGTLTMFFLGIDGGGNKALYVSKVKGYMMHYTTEQVYNLIMTQRPGSQQFVNLLQGAQEFAYGKELTFPTDAKVNLSEVSNLTCDLSDIYVLVKSKITLEGTLQYDMEAYAFLDNGGRFEFDLKGEKKNPTLEDESVAASVYAAYVRLLAERV